VRRLQIYIDEELDDELARQARKLGRSKASLIRESVARDYSKSQKVDPFDAWGGGIDMVPGEVDEIVYGR
jgi:hypothetical protein